VLAYTKENTKIKSQVVCDEAHKVCLVHL